MPKTACYTYIGESSQGPGSWDDGRAHLGVGWALLWVETSWGRVFAFP